jgi:uncharacterized RDD family membrane protein YckC
VSVSHVHLVAPERDLGMQGHYAGAVTRFASFGIDVLAAGLSFSVLSWLVAFGIRTLIDADYDPTQQGWVTVVFYAGWWLIYTGYPLAVSGRTLGMALLGLSLVDEDGSDVPPRKAVLRVLVFPLSFLLFGLGFVGIVLQRERRALHDLIAGTAVVYAWNARAARLRFLAKQRL